MAIKPNIHFEETEVPQIFERELTSEDIVCVPFPCLAEAGDTDETIENIIEFSNSLFSQAAEGNFEEWGEEDQ